MTCVITDSDDDDMDVEECEEVRDVSLSDPRLVIGRLVKYSALIGQILERPPGLSRDQLSEYCAAFYVAAQWQWPGPSRTFQMI